MNIFGLRNKRDRAIILLMLLTLGFDSYLSFQVGDWLSGLIQIAVILGMLYLELDNRITLQ